MIDTNPSLRIFSSVLDGKTYIEDITSIIENYRHSTRLQGGYWQATFDIINLEEKDLLKWFYEYLGNHFECSIGSGVIFEGMIYDITMVLNGIARNTSLFDLINYSKVSYIDGDDTVQQSAWASNTESAGDYGRKEEWIGMDGFPQTTAERRRDQVLLDYQWPQTVAIGQAPKDNVLQVTVCGYVWASNWRYTTTADDSDDTVDDWITDILGTDLTEFLVLGKVQANTTPVKKKVDVPERCWDLINELTAIGDGTNPFRSYVEIGRSFVYEEISNTPEYYIKDGLIYGSIGSSVEVNHWQIQPAVMRDLEYPRARKESGSWFQDARDFLINEVVMDLKSGISFSADHIEESDLLKPSQEYTQQLADWDEQARREAEALANQKPERTGHWFLTMGWSKAEKLKWSKDEFIKKKRQWYKRRKTPKHLRKKKGTKGWRD